MFSWAVKPNGSTYIEHIDIKNIYSILEVFYLYGHASNWLE